MKYSKVCSGNMQILTIPGTEHICYKIINERDLTLGDVAVLSVKQRHYHREAFFFLVVSL